MSPPYTNGEWDFIVASDALVVRSVTTCDTIVCEKRYICRFLAQHVRRESLFHFHVFLAHLEQYSVFYRRFCEGG